MSPAPPERAVRWFDDRQQESWWLGFPVAVVRKYADDRGSALAALVTFQVFLGMLPLLVVVLTVFGTLLEGSGGLRDAALDSTLGQLPVVGDRIREDVSGLVATGPVLLLAVAGLLWTATGIYTSLQLTMNQVWNVEGTDRQGFVSRQLRAVAVFVFVFVAAVGTAPLREVRPFGMSGVPLAIASAVAAATVSSLVLFVVLRLVTAPSIRSSRLVPAAVMAGLLWLLLQRIGTTIVVDRLTRAEDLYGALGVVVVTLFWINLLARSTVIANEWAVVGWRELWPRRIAQPPLTVADRRVLEALVRNERRRPEQHVTVTWDEDADEDDPVRDRPGGSHRAGAADLPRRPGGDAVAGGPAGGGAHARTALDTGRRAHGRTRS